MVEVLRARGACFATELGAATNRLPEDIERALWDGVARGLLTADGFGAIRPFLPASLTPHIRKAEGLVMVGLLLLIFWVPGASAALFRAAAGLGVALGLDLDALRAGWEAFHFWRPA